MEPRREERNGFQAVRESSGIPHFLNAHYPNPESEELQTGRETCEMERKLESELSRRPAWPAVPEVQISPTIQRLGREIYVFNN